MSNFYSVLEISQTSSQTDIKKAYYRLVRVHHPDKNTGSDGEQIRKINEAYAILSDLTQRDKYDKMLENSQSLKPFRREQTGSPGSQPYYSQGNPFKPTGVPPQGTYSSQFPSSTPYQSTNFARPSSNGSSNQNFQNGYYPQRYPYTPTDRPPNFNVNGHEFHSYDRSYNYRQQQNNWSSYGPVPQSSHNTPFGASNRPHDSRSQFQQQGNNQNQKPNNPQQFRPQQSTSNNNKTNASPSPNNPGYSAPKPNTSEPKMKIPPGVNPSQIPRKAPEPYAIPPSWDKQKYQFNKQKAESSPPLPKKSQETKYPIPSPNEAHIPPKTPKIQGAPGKPPFIIQPLNAPSPPSIRPPFAFQKVEFSKTAKPSPQRPNTARNRLSNNPRSTPTPISTPRAKEPMEKSYKNASGRATRTSIEDGLKIDFVSTCPELNDKTTSTLGIDGNVNSTELNETNKPKKSKLDTKRIFGDDDNNDDTNKNNDVDMGLEELKNVPPFTQSTGTKSFDMTSLRNRFKENATMEEDERTTKKQKINTEPKRKPGRPRKVPLQPKHDTKPVFFHNDSSDGEFIPVDPESNNSSSTDDETLNKKKATANKTANKPTTTTSEKYLSDSDSDINSDQIDVEGPFPPREIEDYDVIDNLLWNSYEESVSSFILETKRIERIVIKNYQEKSEKINSFDIRDSQSDTDLIVKRILNDTRQMEGINKMAAVLGKVVETYKKKKELRKGRG